MFSIPLLSSFRLFFFLMFKCLNLTGFYYRKYRIANNIDRINLLNVISVKHYKRGHDYNNWHIKRNEMKIPYRVKRQFGKKGPVSTAISYFKF